MRQEKDGVAFGFGDEAESSVLKVSVEVCRDRKSVV